MEADPATEIADQRTGRTSVDYVLRTGQQNLLQLSAMADQKASVVLGAAFVMATIVFGDVAGSEDLDAIRLALLLTALGAGILAALALWPRLLIDERRQQPLFFGSVAQMERDEYVELMREVLSDDGKIYDAIVEDLHTASVVLTRSKFRPLQASYAVLVVGMTITFVIALFS